MTLLEAQKLTLQVLKQVMEEKLDHHNVQLAQVKRDFVLLIRMELDDRYTPGYKAKGIRDIGREEFERDYRSYVRLYYINTRCFLLRVSYKVRYGLHVTEVSSGVSLLGKLKFKGVKYKKPILTSFKSSRDCRIEKLRRGHVCTVMQETVYLRITLAMSS